ncbi:hypothetical protein [Rhodococcus sp. NPDC058521]|uniref:hypothetical protein n=1 Tax=Rhodococcus sp. NPDC058521 TaxID=3346536 RepID=UPI00366926B9
MPAHGTGVSLSEASVALVSKVFAAARISEPGGSNMIELRHVAFDATARQGAMTRPPKPFLLHAVGAADSAARRGVIDDILNRSKTSRPEEAPAFRTHTRRVGATQDTRVANNCSGTS